jgi:hypothetical protein
MMLMKKNKVLFRYTVYFCWVVSARATLLLVSPLHFTIIMRLLVEETNPPPCPAWP